MFKLTGELAVGALVTAVLPIPAQAADNPREEHSAMLTAAQDQKVEKSSQSTLGPTEYVIETSTDDNKALADKLQPTVEGIMTKAYEFSSSQRFCHSEAESRRI